MRFLRKCLTEKYQDLRCQQIASMRIGELAILINENL